MTVLIEGISVVVRWNAIDRGSKGGRSAFLTTLPDKTYCRDDDPARVGSMAPAHVQAYVRARRSRRARERHLAKTGWRRARRGRRRSGL